MSPLLTSDCLFDVTMVIELPGDQIIFGHNGTILRELIFQRSIEMNGRVVELSNVGLKAAAYFQGDELEFLAAKSTQVVIGLNDCNGLWIQPVNPTHYYL